MADSTAPILMTGGATMLADYMAGQGVKWNVAVATGIAAGLWALFEKADHDLFVGIAWVAFIGSMIAPRPNGAQPPVEVFYNKWKSASG